MAERFFTLCFECESPLITELNGNLLVLQMCYCCIHVKYDSQFYAILCNSWISSALQNLQWRWQWASMGHFVFLLWRGQIAGIAYSSSRIGAGLGLVMIMMRSVVKIKLWGANICQIGRCQMQIQQLLWWISFMSNIKVEQMINPN